MSAPASPAPAPPQPRGHHRLSPWDTYNRRLVARVHPADWVNPRPRSRYHLVVIGAGTGGLVSAAIAAGLGARVALVERGLMGGDCLNFGCVPSKALLRAARAWHEANHAAAEFGGPVVRDSGDFGRAMERMRRIRAEISEHDSAERFRGLGVDVFLGSARFDSRESVQVGKERLRFRRAIVATGARPAVPPVPGLEEAGYDTTESIFQLGALPPRLIVLGAGAVGVELGQAFARFGSRVTLVEIAERLLPEADHDAAALVRRALEEDGVRVLCGHELIRVERHGGEKHLFVRGDAGMETLRADVLLVATGRTPNVEDLDLPSAEVSSDEDGIDTDRHLRTSNRRVFAIGDVTHGPRFTHAADAHARIAVQNALFWPRGRADRLVVPWSVYTEPELAHVGIASEEADRRPDVETLTVPAHLVDRSRLEGNEDGFLRLHLHRRGGEILGATIAHPRAGDLIAIAAHAIASGVSLDTLGEAVLPYPTAAELFRRAADQRRRQRLTPTVARLFRLFFRITS